jgi:hypothetical protein
VTCSISRKLNEIDQINKETRRVGSTVSPRPGLAIVVLTVVDGGQVLIQHPEWFQ